jgi:hypothetical protein
MGMSKAKKKYKKIKKIKTKKERARSYPVSLAL